MKRKRTEITIEIDEVIRVRGQVKRLTRVWCSACGTTRSMVTPQEAALIAGVSVRTIYQWVESEKVHFVETGDGLLFLCLNSLNPLMLPDV